MVIRLPRLPRRRGRAPSVLMLALALTLLLVACGKKGPLEPPAGEPNQYPRTYPSE